MKNFIFLQLTKSLSKIFLHAAKLLEIALRFATYMIILIAILFPLTTNATLNDNSIKDGFAAISLPKQLKPEHAPEIPEKLKQSEEKHNPSWTAALYTNYALQLLAGGLLYLAGPVAIVIIGFAGFNYVISHGDQSKIEGAKKTLTWAIMGLIFIIVSFALVRAIIVLNFVG